MATKGTREKTAASSPGVAHVLVYHEKDRRTVSRALVCELQLLQRKKESLAEELKKAEAILKEKAAPVIVALEAGYTLEEGSPPCAVAVEERRTPAWKDVACSLAKQFLGLESEVYAAQVLSQTVAKVYKRLVINGTH